MGALKPSWRTPAVVELAREITRTLNDALAPILADALEEAEAPKWLVGHFRGESYHDVRHCDHLKHLLDGDYVW